MEYQTQKARAARAAVLADPAVDPLLSYAFCAAESGVSVTTFRQHIVPHLEVIAIGARRLGIRRSVWEAYKLARTRKPAKAA